MLNWGMGHATRSEVIIKELVEAGMDVTIASDGRALQVLQKSFPQCDFVSLPEWDIRYGAKGMSIAGLIRQLPHLVSTWRKESMLVKTWLRKHSPDFIVTDNRPLFCAHLAPLYYMTHQWNVQAGLWSGVARWIHRFWYRKAESIWIPDTKQSELAGALSQTSDSRVRFIGPLSRLSHQQVELDLTWLVVLSGPEPQRSMWEAELIGDMANWPGKGVVFRGVPSGNEEWVDMSDCIRVMDYASPETLSKWMNRAEVVIARTGYSTLMDLYALGKRAVLVPTPGQTEQEYLATWWADKRGYAVTRQGEGNYTTLIHQVLEEPIPQPDGRNRVGELLRFFQREGKR